ncbi:glycosyltransferase family 2 protein [Shewanella livingstonensis]|uniref:Glycosyltransferase family 2 protein n=1 Tax=Shewanella livingstonensis TaxID=150120 RepID=A0A3G8LZU1_9GAMM|nr:glycosyltransferase family 2 protein [Shewanella livingstonensis]AZG74967.1 glycosyltransferase family 2 protein [Shewanella livingstonensis]
MKLALVIPNYNHHVAIEKTLTELARFNLQCYLVDDGSDEQTRYILQALAEKFTWVTLIQHPYNRGKGAAVMSGLRQAYRDGFSHALQVDADGQHNLADIPLMITTSEQHPQALVSGQPIYDESVPKGRLYGRYITHFWVWVETLSFDIQDSMCGFRVYPLAATEQLFSQQALGERMDFDIEIMVKLHWQGTPIVQLPTKVIYPEDGISHFQGVQDNVRISWMHTKLFFGMLARLPHIISKQIAPQKDPTPDQAQSQKHWSTMTERGSFWGIKLLAECYRLGGHWLCRAVMYPVICYFFLTGSTARHASLDFLRRVQQLQPHHPNLSRDINWRDSLKHFFAFGNAALDRIDAWCDRINLDQVDFDDRKILAAQADTGRGAVLIVSHLGNMELCRAISVHQHKVKVNVMVLTQHAENFNKVLQQLNPQSSLNLIHVNELDPSTAMLLQQKIDQGEIVVIAADRTSSSSQGRVTYLPFLGQDAAFPQGPFILASLLDCPVYTLFCIRQHGRYKVYVEHLSDSLKGPRAGRIERLTDAMSQYSQRLAHFAQQAPMQWFNFFDFWRKDELVSRNTQHTQASTTHLPSQDR